MYSLALLLLISPAFGMPSNDLIGIGSEIINQLDSVVGFTEETRAVFQNSNLFELLSGSLKEAEQNIVKMEAELKTFESQELQFENNYFPAYNKAKSYLRQTRQGLRKLADKTVTEVRDLKLLLEAVDEEKDSLLLKSAIKKMKALMIETLETLKEANEKYNSALETFDNLNSSIATHNRKLGKMADTNSDEYKTWTQNARLGVYGAISTATVGCIIADIFGALGICSAVSGGISASAAAGLEVQIAKYSAEITKLVKITGRMLDSGNILDQEITEAIEILTEEIDLINNWANSAEVVNKNIDKYPQQYLKKYRSIRTVFINGLDDLNNSALQFLDQPVDILA